MSTRIPNKSAPEENGYAAFLIDLNLIYVGLKQCSAKLERSEYRSLMSPKTSTAQPPFKTIDSSYEITRMGKGYFEAGGSISVSVQESEDTSSALFVSCSFEAHFHSKGLPAKGHIERFVNNEFELVMAPYARQFISMITSQMTIPPIFLPLAVSTAERSSIDIPKRTKTKK